MGTDMEGLPGGPPAEGHIVSRTGKRQAEEGRRGGEASLALYNMGERGVKRGREGRKKRFGMEGVIRKGGWDVNSLRFVEFAVK